MPLSRSRSVAIPRLIRSPVSSPPHITAPFSLAHTLAVRSLIILFVLSLSFAPVSSSPLSRPARRLVVAKSVARRCHPLVVGKQQASGVPHLVGYRFLAHSWSLASFAHRCRCCPPSCRLSEKLGRGGSIGVSFVSHSFVLDLWRFGLYIRFGG